MRSEPASRTVTARLIGGVAVALLTISMSGHADAHVQVTPPPTTPVGAATSPGIGFVDLDHADGPLAPRRLDIEGGRAIVRFGRADLLASGDLELSVVVDDGTAPRRVVLTRAGGSTTTAEQRLTNGMWTATGPGRAEVLADGSFDADLPTIAATGAQVWATASRDGVTSTSPRFDSSSLRAENPDAATPGTSAWLRDQFGAPTGWVSLPKALTVGLGRGALVVTYAAALPTDVDGQPVTNVVDVVSIRPAGAADAEPAFSIRLDYGEGRLRAYRRGDGEPLSLPRRPVEGRPPSTRPVPTRPDSTAEVGIPIPTTPEGRTSVDVPRATIDQLLGSELGDEAMLGVSRVIALGDGRRVVAEGVSVPLDAAPSVAVHLDPLIAEREQQAAQQRAEEQSARHAAKVIALWAAILVAIATAFMVARWLPQSRLWHESRMRHRLRQRRAAAKGPTTPDDSDQPTPVG